IEEAFRKLVNRVIINVSLYPKWLIFNAPIFDRYVDADDFQDCFIMPAHIVGGTFLGRLHPAITRLCLQGAGTQ
ncbi:hypothetical protein JYI49_21075, partial [Escherichia fergusonii]|nr:hypothetical protein [Escherichia fergusonii]